MNPALMVAIHSSQNGAHSVDDLVAKLRKAGAKNTGSATAMPDYDVAKVDEAVGLGLVMRTADGTLYVNEAKVAERSQSHGWIALVVILVLLSVLASVIALAAAY